MANTYFKKNEDGTKVYLREVIRDHNLFKKRDFWETALLWKIEECHKSFNFQRMSVNGNILSNSYKTRLTNVFLGFAFTLKNFNLTKENSEDLL